MDGVRLTDLRRRARVGSLLLAKLRIGRACKTCHSMYLISYRAVAAASVDRHKTPDVSLSTPVPRRPGPLLSGWQDVFGSASTP
jgi:hypothetical protein